MQPDPEEMIKCISVIVRQNAPDKKCITERIEH